LFQELVVSDYLFEKDRLFAELTVEPLELELYERFAGALGESSPKPDLILYLDLPTEVLLQRIARRARPGESAISAEYIEDLRARYERLWAKYTDAPVLRVNNQSLNYADDSQARERILAIVRAAMYDRGSDLFKDAALSGIRGDAGPSGTPGSASDREVQPSLFGAGG